VKVSSDYIDGVKEVLQDLIYEVQHTSFCECKYCKIIKNLEAIVERC